MATRKKLSDASILRGGTAEALLNASKRVRKSTAKALAAEQIDKDKKKKRKSKKKNKTKCNKEVDKDLCKICETRCASGTVNTSIECSQCKAWYHSNCVLLTDRELAIFDAAPLNFHCVSCSLSNINNINFLQTLQLILLRKLKGGKEGDNSGCSQEDEDVVFEKTTEVSAAEEIRDCTVTEGEEE